MLIAQAAAAIAVGMPFPGALPNQVFIAGPKNLSVEGLGHVPSAGPNFLLVNEKGYVVREFSKDATADAISHWISGASVPSGYVAPDPRKTVAALPKITAVNTWMDVVAMGIKLATERPRTATADEKGLLVLFLSSYGPADHLYSERLNLLSDEAQKASIDVIALFPGKDETKATIARFSALHEFRFGCALDAGNAYADAFRATRTPEAFLLDKNMRVVYTGAIDDSTFGSESSMPYLQRAITDLSIGREVRAKSTRVFGTPIDR